MKIADREIGEGHLPFIVAEISGNHCGHLSNAIRLIKAAKRAGADAVKTQCYDPDSMTLDINKTDFIVQGGLWHGQSLYELYKKSHTPLAWHKELYNVARQEGIPIFSSVFDRRGVDLLSVLGCPAFKIASFEVVDTPLLEYVAKAGKPIIISTGLASAREIQEADEATGGVAAFLHCTSEYPAVPKRADLKRMRFIEDILGVGRVVGISDHTLGDEIPIAATALGASIIEKHLKLVDPDFADGGSEDDTFSEMPTRFRAMADAVRETWEGIWNGPKTEPSRQFRRSLYAVADIKKGEVYTEDNIRSIRPGYGLPPRMLPKLLGTKAKRDWRRGDPLS